MEGLIMTKRKIISNYSYRWGCVPNDEFLLSFKKVNKYLKEIEKFINSKHFTKVF
jgi:NRPS condensation-like uncharacterized protein